MTGTRKSWRRLGDRPAVLSALAAAGVLLGPRTASADPWDWATPTWYKAETAPFPASVVPGAVPNRLRGTLELPDPTGSIGSVHLNGDVDTRNHPFFTPPPHSNGRTCFSCHQPGDGWSIRPETVHAIFDATQGRDPLFAPVDGADCPDLALDQRDEGDEDEQDQVCRESRRSERGDEAERFKAARRQLFSKGNFRIFLPIPPKPEWKLRIVHDPYGCENSTTYGLRGSTPFVSMYRRPLASANTLFLAPGGRPGTNIMWDARESSLENQFVDASLIHAQAKLDDWEMDELTNVSAKVGAAFQDALFVAQVSDDHAGRLDGPVVTGGPAILSGLTNPGSSAPFDLFDAFATATGPRRTVAARQSIARGEAIFNGGRTFAVRDVPGLNDLGIPVQVTDNAKCGTCHNDLDRGNDFFLDPKRLGIADNSCQYPNTCSDTRRNARVALPATPDAPLFSFLCPPGKIPFFHNPVRVDGVDYDEFVTTDPGLGLVNGTCADLGKMKVPVLRGIAGRAPYFHAGNAASLDDLVDFYDKRFNIGFTPDEKQDLVAFLNSL